MTSAIWTLRSGAITLDRPRILGVVNVTPDSFSDGGRYLAADDAIAHGIRLADEGADILDVGGESTRPQGAEPVPVDEELRRVLPVVKALAARGLTVSVDTSKAAVAAAAIGEGAQIVNDVSGLRFDAAMGDVCAAAGAGLVLMHSRGDVRTMGTHEYATYTDPVSEVAAELKDALARARAAGVESDAIVLDPGIGFAKRAEHSLRLLTALPLLARLGRPLLVGVSRKRFLAEITGDTQPEERLHGTTGANVAALSLGARLFRVHDVLAARQSLDVAWAILRSSATAPQHHSTTA